MMGKAPRIGFLLAMSWLCFATTSWSAVEGNRPVEVRILLDNSGSMYPGYEPGSGVTKSELNVEFFHGYRSFRSWLDDFVVRQQILGGGRVSMSALTSNGRSFAISDLQQVHPRVALSEFSAERACEASAALGYGRQTFLKEGLDAYTQNFEGLVWLITDNIVEDGRGNPDDGVLRFFEGLRDNEKYRSVHLYRYGFGPAEGGQAANLAIYGILVSREPVSDIGYFERKFREEVPRARRTGSSDALLFPDQGHLKLKDLSVDAFELRLPRRLQVELQEGERRFRESQSVLLSLPGSIRSHLTQHTVTGGRYTIQVPRGFEPDDRSSKEFGVRPIQPGLFGSVSVALSRPIPPASEVKFNASLSSASPVAIQTTGLWAWLRAAVSGLRVEYTGVAEVRFGDVLVELNRDEMEGVFGAEVAPDVFQFQDLRSISVNPARRKVSFVVDTGSRRGLLLLLVVSFFVAPLVLLVLAISKKAAYSVRVGQEAPKAVQLRRFGRYPVRQAGLQLGVLARSLSGRHAFYPSGLLSSKPAPASHPDSWDLSLPDGQVVRVAISPRGGKAPERKASLRSTGRIRGPGAPAAGSPLNKPRDTKPSGSAPASTPPSKRPTIRRPGG